MFDLNEIGRTLLPRTSFPEVWIEDIHIYVEPSDFLLPSIHIDGRIHIRFPW